MRVLWVCNISFPNVFGISKKDADIGGGWMTSLAQALSSRSDIILSICFPLKSDRVLKESNNNIDFYAIPQPIEKLSEYHKSLEKHMKAIVDMSKPDIIHIHGTEYTHGLSLMNACPDMKYVISLQGLMSACAAHYTGGLPGRALKIRTFRDIARNDSILKSQKRFKLQSIYEAQMLNNTKYVIGRTTFDKAIAMQINPHVQYFHCGETLRDVFYESTWSLENCKRHTVFISQGTYPIKGLHFVMEAAPLILKSYPNTKFIIAGSNITKSDKFMDKIKLSGYGKYLIELLKKHNLKDSFSFIGRVDASRMCSVMKSAHIFILPSAVENSSNSLGEAMMLGLPCVASYCGGTPDMLRNNTDGILYQYDAPYMLAYHVCRLFNDDMLCRKLSENARIRANQCYDKIKNTEAVMSIYKNII